MHVPSPCVWKPFFRDNRNDGICPGKPLAQLCIFIVAPSQRSSPQAISTVSCPSQRSSPQAIYFLQFPVHPCRTLAFTKLFPTVSYQSTMCMHASVSLPRRSNLNENPSIGDAFGKKKTYKCW